MNEQAKVWNGNDPLTFSEDELRSAAEAHRKKLELDKKIKAMGMCRDHPYWEMVERCSDYHDEAWRPLKEHLLYAPVSLSHILSGHRASIVGQVVSKREGTLYEVEGYEDGCFFAVMLSRPGVGQPYIALSRDKRGKEIEVRLLLRRTGRRVRWNRKTGLPSKGAAVLRHWKDQPPVALPAKAYFSCAYREAICDEYLRQRDAMLSAGAKAKA